MSESMDVEKNVPSHVAKHLTGVVRLDGFSHLYSTLEEALSELEIRRASRSLKKAMSASFSENDQIVLDRFQSPRAVLGRHVATPNHEALRFLDFANQAGMRPLVFEYHNDKFVGAENRTKRILGEMPILASSDTSSSQKYDYVSVCDLNVSSGKRIKDVVCSNGEPLVSLHHRIFFKMTQESLSEVAYDGSAWFASYGGKAAIYYEKLLSLFVRDGILFENFMPFRSEAAFTLSVVVPAINKIKLMYGVSPLIVRLLPSDQETDLYWDAYPHAVKDVIWT